MVEVQQQKNIEAALSELVIGNDQFNELERALDVFCPFEAIGMVRQEIRHAHFLGYILDPQRPHGFGSEVLRSFMSAVTKAVQEQGGTLSPLDVHLMALDTAEVRREWRSIDLVVLVPDAKLIVAVELKIDASEHGDQLSRYRQIAASEWPSEAGWRHLFLFLTKTGQSASEVAGSAWVAVSLEDVAAAFSATARKEVGSSEARTMLEAYVGMLRRHHLGDERLEQLAIQLWSQHSEALGFLADRRPDLIGNVFNGLMAERDQLASDLSERFGLSFCSDHSTSSFLRFGITSWDSVPGMLSGTGWGASPRLMLLELEKRSGSGAITARFEIGPGDGPARETIFEALKSNGADVGGNWALSDKWRQLANKVLFRAKAEDPRGVDEVISNVRAGLLKFVEQHLPKYDEVMKRLQS